MTGHTGAPHSIARYMTETLAFSGRWIVFEYVGAEAVVRAIQTKREDAIRYLSAGRHLIDVESWGFTNGPLGWTRSR